MSPNAKTVVFRLLNYYLFIQNILLYLVVICNHCYKLSHLIFFLFKALSI